MFAKTNLLAEDWKVGCVWSIVTKAMVSCLLIATLDAGVLLGAAGIRKPNVVLILADDLGYGDIGVQGSRHSTPNLDRMAREGVRMTSFYAAGNVCTPTRASILTGSYPLRVGLHDNPNGGWVLFPGRPNGLNPDEITITERLKEAGYATACVGKWHLGDQLPFLPLQNGFDHYFGIPYSNNMAQTRAGGERDPKRNPLPLLRNNAVIEYEPDQRFLTRRLTEEALGFISEQRNRPFFLYLAHPMPHWPQYSSEAFAGKSGISDYADAVMEIDWSTGRILDHLQALGLDENTLIVFTSDNGGALSDQAHNGGLRGEKGQIFEGGHRVPMLARWPGRLPAGSVTDAVGASFDLYATLAAAAGLELPTRPAIDGRSLLPLLTGQSSTSPHESFGYFTAGTLGAVRSGRWKLILQHDFQPQNRNLPPVPVAEALFDLDADAAESRDVVASHPEVATRLRALGRRLLAEIERDRRPPGLVADPVPLFFPDAPPDPARVDVMTPDLAFWRQPRGTWAEVGGIRLTPSAPESFTAVAGEGVLLNTTSGKTVDLLSRAEWGDCAVSLEFNLPANSNSGVYLMGRYEVQIRDSFGKESPGAGDNGGIYTRYVDGKSFEGAPPRTNASRAPGEWQKLEISFRAPRFDASGRKTENARFLRVVLNGHVVHEQQEVSGPTRSAAYTDEAARGPLMIQGDHGPVAIRNLSIVPGQK